jgi:hypothetical protein
LQVVARDRRAMWNIWPSKTSCVLDIVLWRIA